MLYAEDFSPNTPQGACSTCHGLGHVYEVTEALMVPDPSLSIRERAIASWPPAWHGQNLRDILVSMGYERDKAVPVDRLLEDFSALLARGQAFVFFSDGDMAQEERSPEERKQVVLWMKARRPVAQGLPDTEIAAVLEVPLEQWLECRMACGQRPLSLEGELDPVVEQAALI